MNNINWPFFITAWAFAGLLTLVAGPAYGLLVLAVLLLLMAVAA